MAELVKYIYGTDAQILALTPSSLNWFDRAFYYPSDKDYFYQALDGVMKKYGSGEGSGIGITLNGKYLAGIKYFITSLETLVIPEQYEYNCFLLTVEGVVNNYGIINMM